MICLIYMTLLANSAQSDSPMWLKFSCMWRNKPHLSYVPVVSVMFACPRRKVVVWFWKVVSTSKTFTSSLCLTVLSVARVTSVHCVSSVVPLANVRILVSSDWKSVPMNKKKQLDSAPKHGAGVEWACLPNACKLLEALSCHPRTRGIYIPHTTNCYLNCEEDYIIHCPLCNKYHLQGIMEKSSLRKWH